MKPESEINLLWGLGGSPPSHGRLLYCDVVDSTSELQAIVDPVLVENASSAAILVPETALLLLNTVRHQRPKDLSRSPSLLSPRLRLSQPRFAM